MTAATLPTHLISTRALWTIPDTNLTGPVRVQVVVCDVRLRCGGVDVMVRPVDGDGVRWVRLGTVTVQP
jgi:hypothetical protein